jgi:hypothetical protein
LSKADPGVEISARYRPVLDRVYHDLCRIVLDDCAVKL